MHDLSVLRQSPVTEIRHGLTSPRSRNAEYFRGRSQAGAAFRNAVVDHRRHSGADRGLIDFQPIGLFPDQFANLVGEFKNLEHADPAAIARTAAALASAGALNGFAAPQAERAQSRVFHKIGLDERLWYFAAVAQLANQPLGDHRSQGRPQQISLDAEIEKPRYRGGRRFGVECRQNEVTGEGGMNGDVSGFW